MLVADAVAAFLAHRQVKVKPNTLEVYQRNIVFWQDWRKEEGYPDEISRITIDEIRSFLVYISQEHVPHGTNPARPASDTKGLAQNSVLTIMRSIRALWNYLHQEGIISDEQASFFRRRLSMPSVPDIIRDQYDDHHIDRLLAVCNELPPEERFRNRAIILLLAESGMRASELCSLQDGHVHLAERQAIIVGKGSKKRYVFWGNRAATELERYLHIRRGVAGGSQPLLRGIGSRNDGESITPNLIRGMLRRMAKQAGVVLPKNAPVHALRHYYARKALDHVDGYILQQLLGHSSSRTTELYVKEHPDRLKKAHRRIFE
jgi:site-specific recombinase XerD